MADELMPKSLKEVDPEEFITAYAAHLKATDKLQIPDWVDVVKTARFKELPPMDRDWFYVRAAAVARQVYTRHGLGVGQLRTKYGGLCKRKGAHPEHYTRASGGLIRNILKQLESLGFVEKCPAGSTKAGGRRITPAGQKDMDLIACRCKAKKVPYFDAAPEATA